MTAILKNARAENRAPQGCDLSADASADWRGGYDAPRAGLSLLESDKSWGRRGKAPVYSTFIFRIDKRWGVLLRVSVIMGGT